jgi:hypothetical protein
LAQKKGPLAGALFPFTESTNHGESSFPFGFEEALAQLPELEFLLLFQLVPEGNDALLAASSHAGDLVQCSAFCKGLIFKNLKRVCLPPPIEKRKARPAAERQLKCAGACVLPAELLAIEQDCNYEPVGCGPYEFRLSTNASRNRYGGSRRGFGSISR